MLFAKVPELETLNSRLLPDLFDLEKLEEGEVIRVLDLGPANSHTFNFLNQFNCHLQVVNIKDKLCDLNNAIADDPDLDIGEIEQYIHTAFSFQGEECFDICLVWDFLNYLDMNSLKAFTAVLLPHLAPEAKLHGFAVLNKNTPLTEQNYGVVDAELLAVSDQKNVQLPHRHSQSAIKDYLRGIAVKQSILRTDGRLEMILQRI